MWPELAKTRKNIQSISAELEKLLREHNSLNKKEIANHIEQILADTESAMETVEEEIKQLKRNMGNHRKQLEAKYAFLRRHNKRI